MQDNSIVPSDPDKSLTSPKALKDLLSRHGFQFSKSLGQNFLIDGNVLNKIVDGAMIDKKDTVLEIGPGVGTLTQGLARKAGKVIAIEIDSSLLPVLHETLDVFDNVQIIHGDILKLDINSIVDKTSNRQTFKVVANLPYYITTPIIMRFLEEDLSYESITVMVQKEVAQRMVASPSTKSYGSLSVAVQFYTQPRLICKVPPTVFMPPPKVESMVISLDKRVAPTVNIVSKKLFFEIVRASFAQRRKTLLNNLYNSELFDLSKDALSEKLLTMSIDPQRRGETLTLDEFAAICNNFYDLVSFL